jgi:DNA-binding transcriptional LysR family regulator
MAKRGAAMTFLQLEYFHAVADSGSISRVAEQYNISPAALSRSISQLERELGVELFDHEGRSIVLNEYGRIFLQCTAEILDSMITARKRLSDLSQRSLVRVRFDVLVDEPGELPISLRLARPDLIVDIVPPHSPNMRFDLRVFATLNKIEDPRTELVFSERYVAALPAKHPLAKRESIALSELKDESFILYRFEHNEETLFGMCEEAGFVPHISISFGMTAHRGIFRAVSEGVGCAIVPELVSRAEWDPAEVALVPFSDITHIRHIYATTPDGEPMNPDCRFVIDTIKSRLL